MERKGVKFRANLIFQSGPRFEKVAHPWCRLYIPQFTMCATCAAHLILLVLIKIIIVSREYKSWSSSFYHCVMVGWWSFAVKGFWALWDNIYECVCCYNRCHGNAVKGFWVLWDNIYDSNHSSIVYYVHVLLYSAAQLLQPRYTIKFEIALH
jgi:hypothetical protein